MNDEFQLRDHKDEHGQDQGELDRRRARFVARETRAAQQRSNRPVDHRRPHMR
jgi:hypothetical protein